MVFYLWVHRANWKIGFLFKKVLFVQWLFWFFKFFGQIALIRRFQRDDFFLLGDCFVFMEIMENFKIKMGQDYKKVGKPCFKCLQIIDVSILNFYTHSWSIFYNLYTEMTCINQIVFLFCCFVLFFCQNKWSFFFREAWLNFLTDWYLNVCWSVGFRKADIFF